MKTKSTFPPHLAEIHALAIETFGSKSKADKWFNKYHPVLGNTPFATAESASGLIEVEKILNAISYGGVV
jgi:uncharacterized protein (DUF2384 family)